MTSSGDSAPLTCRITLMSRVALYAPTKVGAVRSSQATTR